MKLFYTLWALDIFVRTNIHDSKIICFKLLNNNHTFCWKYYLFIKYCSSNCKASTGINSKDCCPVQKDNNVLMSSSLFLNIHGAERYLECHWRKKVIIYITLFHHQQSICKTYWYILGRNFKGLTKIFWRHLRPTSWGELIWHS